MTKFAGLNTSITLDVASEKWPYPTPLKHSLKHPAVLSFSLMDHTHFFQMQLNTNVRPLNTNLNASLMIPRPTLFKLMLTTYASYIIMSGDISELVSLSLIFRISHFDLC